MRRASNSRDPRRNRRISSRPVFAGLILEPAVPAMPADRRRQIRIVRDGLAVPVVVDARLDAVFERVHGRARDVADIAAAVGGGEVDRPVHAAQDVEVGALGGLDHGFVDAGTGVFGEACCARGHGGGGCR